MRSPVPNPDAAFFWSPSVSIITELRAPITPDVSSFDCPDAFATSAIALSDPPNMCPRIFFPSAISIFDSPR